MIESFKMFPKSSGKRPGAKKNSDDFEELTAKVGKVEKVIDEHELFTYPKELLKRPTLKTKSIAAPKLPGGSKQRQKESLVGSFQKSIYYYYNYLVNSIELHRIYSLLSSHVTLP